MQTTQFPLPKYGIDKLSNETSLKKGTWRSAVNVDIDSSGQVGVRQGYAPSIVGNNFHSAWYAAQRGWLLTGKGTGLHIVDVGTATTTLLRITNSSTPFSYTEYNGNLYAVNAAGLLWSRSGSNTVDPCGVASPTPPVATPTSVGGLAAGKYSVAISTIDAYGEESAMTQVQRVEVPAPGGGIQLTGLPSVTGGRVAIYVTTTNGDVLYLYAIPSGTLSSHLVSGVPDGFPMDNVMLQPFPGGRFVRWHNGRLYVASGSTLYYSEALRPHLTRLDTNFIQFSGAISFVEAVQGGIFVGDARGVWFLDGGDPTKFVMKRVASCIPVVGSSVVMPSEHFDPKVVQTNLPVAVWLSTSGYTVGTAVGDIIELNYDTIRIPLGLVGNTTFSIRNGRKQLTTLMSPYASAYGLAIDSAGGAPVFETYYELREDGGLELRE